MEQATRDPRGIHIRSKEAIARWEQDKWSSAITFYEEKNMAQCLKPATAETQNKRVISLTEAEGLFGFLADWTHVVEPDSGTRPGQNIRQKRSRQRIRSPRHNETPHGTVFVL